MWGYRAIRIEVIINGVDLREFVPGASDRTKLGLPEREAIAFFAGDIRTPRKNLDTVLQALVEVPDLHLVVAGSVENSPYPKLAESFKIDHRVHFMGYRRDMSELMRATDLFIFPSRYEACSLVILEAMASGLPVITALSSGGAELVTSDCGIVLSDPENLSALTMALQKLTADPQLRAAMGKQARHVAQQNSWTEMADKYLQLFRDRY